MGSEVARALNKCIGMNLGCHRVDGKEWGKAEAPERLIGALIDAATKFNEVNSNPIFAKSEKRNSATQSLRYWRSGDKRPGPRYRRQLLWVLMPKVEMECHLFKVFLDGRISDDEYIRAIFEKFNYLHGPEEEAYRNLLGCFISEDREINDTNIMQEYKGVLFREELFEDIVFAYLAPSTIRDLATFARSNGIDINKYDTAIVSISRKLHERIYSLDAIFGFDKSALLWLFAYTEFLSGNHDAAIRIFPDYMISNNYDPAHSIMLAYVLFDAGDYCAGLQILKRVENCDREIRGAKLEAIFQILLGIGVEHAWGGRAGSRKFIEDASNHYKKAETLLYSLAEPDSEFSLQLKALLHNNLGHIELIKSDPDLALAECEINKAIEYGRRTSGGHEYLARRYVNLAEIYRRQGRFVESDISISDAEAYISERSSDHFLRASIHNEKGLSKLRNGKPEESLEHFNATLTSLRRDGRPKREFYFLALLNIASSYLESENLVRANDVLKFALREAEAELPSYHPVIQEIRYSLDYLEKLDKLET